MTGLFETKGNVMKKSSGLAIGIMVAALSVLVSCAPQAEDDGAEEEVSAVLDFVTLSEGVIDFSDGIKMEFVQLSPGSFQMGSDTGLAAEKPVHTVELTKSFWMAQTEVTQEQYLKVMEEEPEFTEDRKHPMTGVSWKKAVAYCEKLTAHGHETDTLPEGYAYALPTEAQWEYACRAGTTGDYAGDVDAMAWHKGNSEKKTHPVAQKQANAWGLYDMHGNVWEWCQDVYNKDFYAIEAATHSDPLNVERGPYRVLRGGAWLFNASQCRSAFRFGDNPGSGFSYIGFRICLIEAPVIESEDSEATTNQ